MVQHDAISARAGARKMGDVPSAVLSKLATGEIETVNLMEWLAADMSALARTVAHSLPIRSKVRAELLIAAENMVGAGVTSRLRFAGQAVANVRSLDDSEFRVLSTHNSDLVRQWACYAVNDSPPWLSTWRKTGWDFAIRLRNRRKRHWQAHQRAFQR
jgi:hypothetical protein